MVSFKLVWPLKCGRKPETRRVEAVTGAHECPWVRMTAAFGCPLTF